MASASYYTRRVRNLSVIVPSLHGEGIFTDDASDITEKPLRAILNVLLDYHHLALFARLRQLYVRGMPVDIVFRFALLAGSNLTSVVAEQIPPFDCVLAKDLFTSRHFRPNLTQKFLHMHRLQLTTHYYPDDWVWDEEENMQICESREHDLRVDFHNDLRLFLDPVIARSRNLTTIRVAPDDDTLYKLSLLSSLKELHLDIYDHREVEDFDTGRLRNRMNPFPSLDKLTLTIRGYLPASSRVLENAKCFPHIDLRIYILSQIGLSDLNSLLILVIDTQVMAQLRRFWLRSKGLLPIDDQVAFKTFDSLLSLHQLEEVDIDVENAIDVTQADTQAMVQSWPNIRKLDLGTRSDGAVPGLDLNGLVLFSQSPHLYFLAIRFNTMSSTPVDHLPPFSSSKLEWMCVGESPMIDVSQDDVAAVLGCHFPCLRRIICDSNSSYYGLWRKVEKKLRRRNAGPRVKKAKRKILDPVSSGSEVSPDSDSEVSAGMSE